MVLPRLTVSSAGALVMTAALLLFMQRLIDMPYVAPEIRPFKPNHIGPIEKPEEPKREPKPERLPPPTTPPEVQPPEFFMSEHVGPAITAPTPVTPVAPPIKRSGTGFGDGGPMYVSKVAPIYPPRAIARGLEGSVIVQFTVTNKGAVRDAAVVESTHRVFEKSAVEAALRFKYRPRVVDGVAVDTPGVRNRFTFTLDE